MKRKYEIGFVINPEASEEDVKKVIDAVVGIIKKTEGIIENIDEWGRRKLAYPIQKHTEGIYIFINTEMVGSTFFEVERRLKLSEKVMRFVILRLDDKLKKANKLTKRWKRLEKLSRKSQENRDENSSRAEPGKSRPGAPTDREVDNEE